MRPNKVFSIYIYNIVNEILTYKLIIQDKESLKKNF